MNENEIPYQNLFMVCTQLNPKAYSELPAGYHFRLCRKDELEAWKRFPYDKPEDAEKYNCFMTEYYNEHYAPKGDLFFQKCLFVCDEQDMPVATCFLWKQYDKYTTVHWFKTLKKYEGQGIGRALMSELFKSVKSDDYPIYLHTQSSSFRAIKLYTDFGFSLITGPKIIDNRINQLQEALHVLKEFMPEIEYAKLNFIDLTDRK